MIEIDRELIETGTNSREVATEVVRYLGATVGELQRAGFSNHWDSRGRTEYHMIYMHAPGFDVNDPEWERAFKDSKKGISVHGGRILTRPGTENPVYASVHGEFPHTGLEDPIHRIVETAADSWHARLMMPTPEVGQSQRVVMDSWRMPMRSFWEKASSTLLSTPDEVAEYDAWYRTWQISDAHGVPVRALDVKHDVFGRDESVDKSARRRLLWYADKMSILVANECEFSSLPVA